MKYASRSTLVAILLFSAFNTRASAPDAGAGSVAAALKALEMARANLAAAVKAIAVEPPANADLDTAHDAVGALKDAIDFGTGLEQEDLDYAKAVLAARKELRTQREYVDQRRGKVKIFAQRRIIDAAISKLTDAAKRLEANEPKPTDFEEARAAGKALQAALDESRPFAPQDPGFATYLAQTDATLGKQQKAIDDRFVFLSADKHRALVEEARKLLAASLAALNTTSTDAQFKEADVASASLEKRLTEGRPLEAEKSYHALAEKGRAEVTDAKRKRDALWTETGLERLKAEIEPTNKDLLAAVRLVHGRKPTPDQLAEAKTIAVVMRKLLEKFQPEAERSAAFAQYVQGVKVNLVEVEVQLQLKGLDAALTDVKHALRNLERKVPTDDHFAEVSAAILVLEKTLETAHVKDPSMVAAATNAKQWLHDAKLTATKRRLEVDVDAQTTKVEDARKKANALQLASLPADQVAEADSTIDIITMTLDKGTELTKRDRQYATYDREVRARIAELKARLAARRVVLAAGDGKAQLLEAIAQSKAAIEAARLPASSDAEFENAVKKLEVLGKTIDGNAALEQQNAGYAANAERARNEVFRQTELLEMARQALDLRKRTGGTLAAGEKDFAAAESSKELRAKKAGYEKALEKFKSCAADGVSLVKGNPMLAKALVLVDGLPSTPQAVSALCAQRAEATTPLIKPLVGLIAFDDGPKRAFEKAKAAMAKNDKTEALAQYEECTATGITLQYRSPELKDRAFEVAGAQMTLSEVTKQCSAQGKALRGK
jgi:hypothetical protein